MKSTKSPLSDAFAPLRILVPVDFSAPSLQALCAAVTLAKQFGSHLAVAHVTRCNRPENSFLGKQTGVPFDERRIARKRLSDFIAKEVPDEIDCIQLVIDGVPFDEIIKTAKAWKADLIVVATHGSTGLKHVILGSTAERVVRNAPCPVLAVRECKRRGVKVAFSPAKVSSILAPVDFVKLSLDVLPYAIDLARNSKAQLTIVHVVESFHADMYMDTTQSQRDIRAAARQRLNKLTENTKKTWSRTGYDLRSGHPVTSIASLAKRTNADLIVMGTHGRSGILRCFIGSVAERVVRHAPCSVLVVR